MRTPLVLLILALMVASCTPKLPDPIPDESLEMITPQELSALEDQEMIIIQLPDEADRLTKAHRKQQNSLKEEVTKLAELKSQSEALKKGMDEAEKAQNTKEVLRLKNQLELVKESIQIQEIQVAFERAMIQQIEAEALVNKKNLAYQIAKRRLLRAELVRKYQERENPLPAAATEEERAKITKGHLDLTPYQSYHEEKLKELKKAMEELALAKSKLAKARLLQKGLPQPGTAKSEQGNEQGTPVGPAPQPSVTSPETTQAEAQP